MENQKLEALVQEVLNKIEEREKNERETKEKRKETALIFLIIACGVTIGTTLGQLILRLF